MEERKKQRKEVSKIKIEGAIKEGPGNRAMFNFMGRLWGVQHVLPTRFGAGASPISAIVDYRDKDCRWQHKAAKQARTEA